MKGISSKQFIEYCQAICDAELERAKREFPLERQDSVELIGPLGLIANKLKQVKQKRK